MKLQKENQPAGLVSGPFRLNEICVAMESDQKVRALESYGWFSHLCRFCKEVECKRGK